MDTAEGPVLAGEGGEPAPAPIAQASTALISRVVDYIANVAPRLLFDMVEPTEALLDALHGVEGQKSISRFLTDGKVSALFLESPVMPGGASFTHDWPFLEVVTCQGSETRPCCCSSCDGLSSSNAAD